MKDQIYSLYLYFYSLGVSFDLNRSVLKVNNSSTLDSNLRKSSATPATQTTPTSLPPPPPPPRPLEPVKSKPNDSTMKKVNWSKIIPQTLPENCFWTKHQNYEVPDLFDGLAKNFSLQREKNKFKPTAATPLRVINTCNAQSLLILLRVQYKNTSHDQIKKYILDCNENMLTVDFIETLMKSWPHPYQIKQLIELNGTTVELAEPENFLASLCNIERLLPRLRCIKFKINFNDMVKVFTPNIEVGIAACKQLILSRKFGEILILIRSVGNIMNCGSDNGEAVAFELPILTKLNDIKAADNKQTLLHFVVETMGKINPDLLSFGDELSHVNEAARLDLEQIEDGIKKISTEADILEKELEQNNVPQFIDDKFDEIMTPFLSQCKGHLELLEGSTIEMKNGYMKVADHFGFKTNEYPMKECFSTIVTFQNLFSKAQIEISKTQKVNGTAGHIENVTPIEQQQNATVVNSSK